MTDRNLIYIDKRQGSKDLASHVSPRSLVRMGIFDADVEFLGWGPGGVPYLIGIEYKKVNDLLQCIADGRFTGTQLPRMLASYDRVYLLIEGTIRAAPRSGRLQVRRQAAKTKRWGWRDCAFTQRTWRFDQVDGWLTTLQERAGVMLKFSQEIYESGIIVRDLYNWWQKDYESHASHLKPDMSKRPPRAQNIMIPTSDAGIVRRIAKELPTVGWDKARYIEQRFQSVEEMVSATEEDWLSIEWKSKSGKRMTLGQASVGKIMKALSSADLG